MSEVLENVEKFTNFFGGEPDDVMECEYLPCKEVLPTINQETVSRYAMAFVRTISDDQILTKEFDKFQLANRELLNKWEAILKDRIAELKSTDSRILYRYNLETIPDTFRIDLRLAAIPTKRGVVIASWVTTRMNDENKTPVMMCPAVSLMSFGADEDVDIIDEAIESTHHLNGDAGAVMSTMVEILNRTILMS